MNPRIEHLAKAACMAYVHNLLSPTASDETWDNSIEREKEAWRAVAVAVLAASGED